MGLFQRRGGPALTCQPAREGMVGREGETLRRECAVVRVKVARGQLADRLTAHTLGALPTCGRLLARGHVTTL